MHEAHLREQGRIYSIYNNALAATNDRCERKGLRSVYGLSPAIDLHIFCRNKNVERSEKRHSYDQYMNATINTLYKEERRVRRRNDEKKAECLNSSQHNIIAKQIKMMKMTYHYGDNGCTLSVPQIKNAGRKKN